MQNRFFFAATPMARLMGRLKYISIADVVCLSLDVRDDNIHEPFGTERGYFLSVNAFYTLWEKVSNEGRKKKCGKTENYEVWNALERNGGTAMRRRWKLSVERDTASLLLQWNISSHLTQKAIISVSCTMLDIKTIKNEKKKTLFISIYDQ